MKHCLLRFLCICLSIATLLCFTACELPFGKSDGENNQTANIPSDESSSDKTEGTEDPQEETPVEDPFVPVLRFAAVSDIHIADTAAAGDVGPDRVAALFDTAYDYSATDTGHSTLDVLLVVGDFTDDGTPAQMKTFFDTVKANKKTETTVLVSMGNHEFYPSSGEIQNMLSASGYSSVDLHEVIGGYHFIGISPDDNDGRSYSQSKVDWLSQQLATAAAADPTKRKPIFVFQHQPISGTVFGSEPWAGHPELDAAMKKYPQVVDLSGHSHFPVNDPRSIYQKDYTLINTGSLRYYLTEITGANLNAMVYPVNQTGGWDYCWKDNAWLGESITESGEKNAAQYTVIEVDAKNRLRVLRYDLFSRSFMTEPIIIDSVGQKNAFTFTDKRISSSETPYFQTGTELTATVTSSYISVSVPQAICRDNVQNYRCELYRGREKIKTVYRLSCTNLCPTPDTITVPFGGLSENTEYTVRVFPVSSFGKVGACLSLKIRTPQDVLKNGLPVADIFSVNFRQNGTAFDTVSNTTLRSSGNPTTVYDSTLQRYVAVLDGNSNYQFYGIEDSYELLGTSITMEAYIKLDSLPASGSFVDIFSNQEAGGFGLECKAGGAMKFYLNVAGTYQKPGGTVRAGEYVHIVGTYDGHTVKIYINGVLTESVDCEGTMRLPHAFARYLCVGGDSGQNTSGDFCMTGTIAVANLYARALSASQISALYNSYR